MQKFIIALIALLGLAALLAACDRETPFNGQLINEQETFSGSSIGLVQGGSIILESSKGRTCLGRFVYKTKLNGSGVFNCDDGASGTFTFVVTGSGGTGRGTLGGKPFTFTFG